MLWRPGVCADFERERLKIVVDASRDRLLIGLRDQVLIIMIIMIVIMMITMIVIIVVLLIMIII